MIIRGTVASHTFATCAHVHVAACLDQEFTFWVVFVQSQLKLTSFTHSGDDLGSGEVKDHCNLLLFNLFIQEKNKMSNLVQLPT